jgi:general secretion pathway protein D
MRVIIVLGICLGLVIPLYCAEKDKSQIVEQGDKVMINLKNADIAVIVEYLSRFSGSHYLIDPTVKGSISIMANKPVSRKEAVIILEEALIFHNFTIMQHGLAKYVIPTRFAKQYGIEMKMGADGVKKIDTANIEMRFFKLEYISVRKMNTILNTIMSKNGQIIPHVQEKMLQIIDQTFSLKRMAELIEKMDKPDALLELYVIHLQNTQAGKMVAQLKSVFAKNLILRESPNELEAEEDKINFIADDRTNKILVICHQKYIEQIRATTRVLDQELGIIQQVQLYQVRNGDPDELAKNLIDLFPKDTVKIKPDERLHALLIISQSDRMIQAVLQMAARLDMEAPKGSGDVRVYYLEHSDAKEMAETLNKLFEKKKSKNPKDQLSIVPDEATNALVITATRQMWEEILEILKMLDIFRAQVLVEAVIVEVNMSFARELGVNLAQLGGQVMSDGILGFGIISDPSLAIGQGLNIGVVDQATDADELFTATPRALLRIFKNSSQANLLSAPQILTMDNEEATINVGELVPIQTTTSTSINQSSNIRFEDVGLDLTIKPRITQKKTISLDVKLEVKSRSPENIQGISVPIIGRRALTTVINTKHGGTVVIGGLMKDEKSTIHSRVPLVSRIPFLGKLFQSKKRENKKTNLFVFLTPYVLSDNDEVQAITKDLNQRMNQSMDTSEFNPLSFIEGKGVNTEKTQPRLSEQSSVAIDRISIDGISESVESTRKVLKSSKVVQSKPKKKSKKVRSKKRVRKKKTQPEKQKTKTPGVQDSEERLIPEEDVEPQAVLPRSFRRDRKPQGRLSRPLFEPPSKKKVGGSEKSPSARTPDSFLASLSAKRKAAARAGSSHARGGVSQLKDTRIVGSEPGPLDGGKTVKMVSGSFGENFEDLLRKLREKIEDGPQAKNANDQFDVLVSKIKAHLEHKGI